VNSTELLGVLATVVSGISAILVAFWVGAKQGSAIRAFCRLLLILSLIALFIIAVFGFGLWLHGRSVRAKTTAQEPSPSITATVHSPTTSPSRPSPTPTPTPTPTPKKQPVLLPTPTRIEILPRKWFTDPDGGEIWDPRECGYINERGELQISPQWDRAYSFSEGLALVRTSADADLYYIDTDGKFVLKTTSPRHGGNFVEGLAPAKDLATHQWGYINRARHFAIPARYYMTTEFSEGLGQVQISEKQFGFVNRDGQLVISGRWSNVGTFSEGLASVSQGGKWGYIDTKSNVVIPLQWGNAGQFSEGVATVREGNVCTLIDKRGAILVRTAFDHVGLFSNGFAIARQRGKYGFINMSGKPVTPFEWDEIMRDDRQGTSHRIYWNLAKRSVADIAIAVWFDPDLKEIWRAKLPLIQDKY